MKSENKHFRGRFPSTKTLLLAGAAVLLMPLSFTACGGGARTTTPSAQVARSAQVASAGSMPQNTTGEKILLEGLQFDRDGSAVRHNSDPILDSAADILKSKPDTRVYVDSYCDPTGSKDVNLRLSGDRAIAVATYLEHKGIAADRLIPRGFGATDFVASNATADGREQNRRVELKLVPIGRQASSAIRSSLLMSGRVAPVLSSDRPRVVSPSGLKSGAPLS